MTRPGFFQPNGRQLSSAGILLLMAPFFMLIGFAFLYPLLSLLSLSVTEPEPGLSNYVRILDNPLYFKVLLRTLWIAVLVSVLALLMAFPVAMAMVGSSGPMAVFITACVLLPFWSSVLVRTAAWAVLLQRNGIVNDLLQVVGITSEPIRLLYTQGAVVVAMTHVLLPFMVLPIYGALRNIPPDYDRANAEFGSVFGG